MGRVMGPTMGRALATAVQQLSSGLTLLPVLEARMGFGKLALCAAPPWLSGVSVVLHPLISAALESSLHCGACIQATPFPCPS